MKWIFSTLLLGVIVWGCENNTPINFRHEFKANSVVGPLDSTSLVWVDPVFIDLGKSKRGPTIDVTYRFKNTGKKPLIIDSVFAGCGCTLFAVPEKPVMPGEKKKIVVQFVSSQEALAHHIKHVYIKSNVKGKPYDTLAFKIELTEN